MTPKSLDAGGEDEGAGLVGVLSNQDEVAMRRVEQVAPMSLKGKMREYQCQVRASEEGSSSHPNHAHKPAYVHTQTGTEGEGRRRPKQITKLQVTRQGPGKQ